MGRINFLIMSNWQDWYTSFLANKKARELEAFNKAFNGEAYIVPKFSTLNVNSNWSDFISQSYDMSDQAEINFNNNNLYFNLDILNLALSKSMKQLNLIYPYDDSLIQLLLFKKINDNYTLTELIKILREPPIEWFLVCSSCDFENEDGWLKCKYCQKSFEETLED